MPELQDLMARGRVLRLARQLNAWAVETRQPRMLLLREAARGFFPRPWLATNMLTAPWFHADFIHRHRAALCICPVRVKFIGHMPSSQYNIYGLEGERRLAAHWDLHPYLIREVRYPYLDRDFLDFMYAVPRTRVVTVGQHRSLMRRALVGIVPDELLNRKRLKAFVRPESEREKANHKSADMLAAVTPGQHMVSSALGIIDPSRFSEALQRVSSNDEVLMRTLTLTLRLESWLRHLAAHKVLSIPNSAGTQGFLEARASRIVPSVHSSVS